MMTFAPEIDGGIELTRELTRQGWVASVGHTKASVEILDQAFAAGAKHLTHFYNAMTGLHHRDVGVVGWAFANKDVTFDIIADGIHVHPRPLEFACRAKGCDKVTLISDSVAPTGLGDGEFELWGEKISVINGRTQNERGSIAGSVISMSDAIRQMFELGFSMNETEQMASLNPARLLGLESSHGSLESKKRSDIVVLSDRHSIEAVLIGGKRVPI
jgi:N-acetylglucosamine-6-phosphate deacetylase